GRAVRRAVLVDEAPPPAPRRPDERVQVDPRPERGERWEQRDRNRPTRPPPAPRRPDERVQVDPRPERGERCEQRDRKRPPRRPQAEREESPPRQTAAALGHRPPDRLLLAPAL